MNGKLIGLVVIVLLIFIGVRLMAVKPAPVAEDPASLKGYTDRMKTAQEKAKVAVSTTDIQTVKAAVDRYKAEKDVYPPSLEELKNAGFMDRVVPGLNYDPATGEVSPAP